MGCKYGWVDLDADCPDARTEIIIYQLVAQVKFKTDKECRVGSLDLTIHGNTIDSSSDVDIGHVLALK